MKKQNFPIGLMMIVASMLLYSCSNNDTGKADNNMVFPYNASETTTNAAADSIAKTKETATAKDSTTSNIKEENEEKEKAEDEKNEK